MRAWLAATTVAGCLAVFARVDAAPQAPTASDLARQLQQHYATIRDFTADFTFTYRGGFNPQKTVEHGSVSIKKPGRMRWLYDKPERKEYVADGTEMYSYIPTDRSVTVQPLPKGDEVPSLMLFLTGKGDLIRDFTAAMDTSEGSRAWRLDLTPNVRQADFDTLSLIIDRQTLKTTGLSTVDAQGGTSAFAFANLRENVGLPDSLFVFDLRKLPRGTDVIRDK
jgi:outer membrane lipoprotein carrier protein